jgi:hypothetical protein
LRDGQVLHRTAWYIDEWLLLPAGIGRNAGKMGGHCGPGLMSSKVLKFVVIKVCDGNHDIPFPTVAYLETAKFE